MAQWQSQTRRMNRHYQSTGESTGEIIWNNYDYLDVSATVYGLESYTDAHIRCFEGAPDSNYITITMYGNFYAPNLGEDDDDSDHFQWEEHFTATFLFATDKMESVKDVERTYNSKTYACKQLIIPIKNFTVERNDISNYSVWWEPPENPPFYAHAEKAIITIPYGYSDFIPCWYMITGTDSEYEYVNSLYNTEAVGNGFS